MTVTAVIGAQFGSEGKGAVIAAMADKFDAAVRTGGPNAGHSLWHDGEIFKMRQIPCPWINPRCELILGAGAVLDLEMLHREIEDTGRIPLVDRNAVVITEEEVEAEKTSSLTHQGSTLEGVGAARIRKIWRDVDGPSPLASAHWPNTMDTVRYLHNLLADGKHILLEGTQGSGLSLHHGQWPHVTSQDTNAAQLAADAGIPPQAVEHVILVARTFPIRVGGPSGPMKDEMSWDEFPGIAPERTTVTKKIRRIGWWDEDVFGRAVMLNDPCGIALTFLDYIDPSLAGTSDPEAVWTSQSAMEFIKRVEREADAPVIMVGTGGPKFQMVSLEPCIHGIDW